MPLAIRSFIADARNSPQRALVFIALLLVVIGWLSSRVEWWGAPIPVRFDNWTAVVVGDAVEYRVSGVKLTNAVLISNTATWLFTDGASQPMNISRPDSPDVPVVQPVRRAGDTFTSSRYSVRIPPAAANDSGVRLRVCWGYDSEGLVCIERALADMPVA